MASEGKKQRINVLVVVLVVGGSGKGKLPS